MKLFFLPLIFIVSFQLLATEVSCQLSAKKGMNGKLKYKNQTFTFTPGVSSQSDTMTLWLGLTKYQAQITKFHQFKDQRQKYETEIRISYKGEENKNSYVYKGNVLFQGIKDAEFRCQIHSPNYALPDIQKKLNDAITSKDHTTALNLLLNSYEDNPVLDYNTGITALHQAVRSGNSEITQLILGFGATPAGLIVTNNGIKRELNIYQQAIYYQNYELARTIRQKLNFTKEFAEYCYNKTENTPAENIVVDAILELLAETNCHQAYLKGLFANQLDFGLNDLQISDLSPLAGFEQSLTGLDLSGNQLKSLDGIKKFTNLKTLIAENNQLSSLDFIKQLTGLQTLILSDNKITDLQPLKELPLLNDLRLGNNPIPQSLDACLVDNREIFQNLCTHIMGDQFLMPKALETYDPNNIKSINQMKYGRTLLWLAVNLDRSIEEIRFLAYTSLDIDIIDQLTQTTALARAVQKNNLAAAEVLMLLKANTNFTTSGKSLMMLATSHQMRELIVKFQTLNNNYTSTKDDWE